jgi:hypothetical protein
MLLGTAAFGAKRTAGCLHPIPARPQKPSITARFDCRQVIPLHCQFYEICMKWRRILDSHRGIVVDDRTSSGVHSVRL